MSLSNELIPFHEDGDRITVKASSDITGKRFVKPTGRVSGPGLASSADGGTYQGAPADAGGWSVGVASHDAVTGKFVTLVSGHGHIVPVTADGAINPGDAVMVGSAGKAKAFGNVAATAGHADTGIVGNNNALTWTAVATGENTNTYTVRILGSTGNSVALAIAVNGDDIVVTPATDGGGAITTTAAAIIAALAASPANGFVTIANKSTSTGAGAVAAQGPVQFSGGADAAAGGVIVGRCMATVTDGNDAEIRLNL